MTRAEAYMWEMRLMMEGDNELSTLSRYANTQKGQAARYAAWFAPIEQAEYYTTRAYERPTSHVSR